VNSEEYDLAVWQCGQVREELVRLGGAKLLNDASAEAEELLARNLPWDGHGTEPQSRIQARLEVLVMRLDQARGAPGTLV
jgi:hypothetical protein